MGFLLNKILFLLFLFFSLLYSHQNRCSYLTFDYNNSKPLLIWEIETKNFKRVLNIDDNRDDIISLEELKNNRDKIINYSKNYFHLSFDNKSIEIRERDFEIKEFNKLYFLVLQIPLPKRVPKEIKIDYNLFFKIDNMSRCFITFKEQNNTSVNTLFPFNEELIIKPQNPTTLFQSIKEFLIEGIWHILVGIDHLLFLLMLIIPVVKERESFKVILIDVAKIVTAFSVAHSITLSLSALKILTIPSEIIDILIALSILITALNNIFEKMRGFSWQIAFSFGLIHGFGFANSLLNLVIDRELFIYFLASFNIGIEIGQLFIVLTLLPLLFLIRKTTLYKKGILKGVSFVTLLIALIFIIERVYAIIK